MVLRGASVWKSCASFSQSRDRGRRRIPLGTLVLTATVRAAMRDQSRDDRARTGSRDSPRAGVRDQAPLDSSLAARVAAVPGVSSSVGEVVGPIELVGRDQSGVNAVGASVASAPGLRGFVLKTGRFPSGPGQVVVNESTVKAQHWNIGEEISAAGSGPAQQFKIVGIGADTVQDTSAAAFTIDAAQQLLGLTGRYTDIVVSASHGVSPTVLATRISALLGQQYQVLTADQIEDQAVTADFKAFSLLSSVLVVLGAIVLFVAAFLVVNTFSIVVAQRTRELALLRCLGASRAQLMTSVLAEALVVGVLAAVVGVALGIADRGDPAVGVARCRARPAVCDPCHSRRLGSRSDPSGRRSHPRGVRAAGVAGDLHPAGGRASRRPGERAGPPWTRPGRYRDRDARRRSRTPARRAIHRHQPRGRLRRRWSGARIRGPCIAQSPRRADRLPELSDGH